MRHLGKAVVLLALAAVPADAHGAALFGGTVAGSVPDQGFSTNATGVNNVSPGTQLIAPHAGVITRIRVRHGATNDRPGSVAFRILTDAPSFPTLTARPATPNGVSQRLPLPPNSADGIVSFTPNDANGRRIGVPVAAGERLGIHQSIPSGGVATIASDFNGPNQIRFVTNDHATGTQAYGSGSLVRIRMDALLEPDRDRDSYGDETQDNCPSVANDQTSNPCPERVVVERLPGPERVVTVPVPTTTRVVEREQLCTVPRLRGLTLAAATRRLERAGCRRGRRTGSRARRARVRTQTIPAGTRVARGTRVGFRLRAPARRRR